MRTIVCGVDSSPGARAALRVAVALAESMDARLVAVHVLDRLIGAVGSAERTAARIVDDEVPASSAEARGEVGDVAERIAAVAREEQASMIVLGARSRGRSHAYLHARCSAELAELTTIPIVVAPFQQTATAPALAGSGSERSTDRRARPRPTRNPRAVHRWRRAATVHRRPRVGMNR